MKCPVCGELSYALFDYGIVRVEDGKKTPLKIQYAYCKTHTQQILRGDYEDQEWFRQQLQL